MSYRNLKDTYICPFCNKELLSAHQYVGHVSWCNPESKQLEGIKKGKETKKKRYKGKWTEKQKQARKNSRSYKVIKEWFCPKCKTFLVCSYMSFVSHKASCTKAPWNKGKKGVQAIWNKGLPKEQQPRYGKKHSENTKKLQSEARRRQEQDPEYKKRRAIKAKEVAQKPTFRANVSKGKALSWAKKTDEEKRNYLRNLFGKAAKKPNKSEQFLFDFLEKNFPGEFGLNTKVELLELGGKIPDYVYLGKRKLLIELFGNWYHSKEFAKRYGCKYTSEEDRIKYFKKFDYKTLVIWGRELKDLETLKYKIEKFLKS